MKKRALTFIVILFTTITFSQRVAKGESQINAGLGFASGWGVPFYGGFDYGVHEDITIGAQASFASTNKNFGFDTNNVKGTWFGLGVNGNYHFNTLLEIPNKWDVYAGITIAYNSFSWNYPSSYPNNFKTGSSSGVGIAGQVGARYYFSDKFGVNLEFGGGNVASGGKLGISFKL